MRGDNKIEYEAVNPNGQLMQFTGLHDKNGKEIWEGDIYEWQGEKRTISFDDGKFQSSTGFGQYVDLYLHAEDCEVLGNIYQHQDLLEKEES